MAAVEAGNYNPQKRLAFQFSVKLIRGIVSGPIQFDKKFRCQKPRKDVYLFCGRRVRLQSQCSAGNIWHVKARRFVSEKTFKSNE